MWKILERRAQARFIDDGHVFCPARGHDVEFDLCAGCASLVDLELDAEQPCVRCNPVLAGPWPERPFPP